jgi:ribosomal-protein-alanine N-acetyltransferase
MSIGFERVELVGDRVRLRSIREDDAADAYQLVSNDTVIANLAWDGPAGEAEIAKTYRRLERELKSGESHCFAIERVYTSGLIGCIDTRFPRHPQQADIGYWLGVPYWNNGYMTEAVRLICHFSFKYLDSVRAYATVFVGNTGSRKVLEKNGFSLDGTLRGHVYKRGGFLDAWFFTLLRSEWERDRERFYPRQEDIIVIRSGE